MAENIFRSSRRRDVSARQDSGPAAHRSVSDPLAELARLIGQSDPHGGRAGAAERFDETATASQLDWAADPDYSEPSRQAEPLHLAPRAAHSHPSYAPDSASVLDRHDSDGEPLPSHLPSDLPSHLPSHDYAAAAARFNGAGEGGDAVFHYRDEQAALDSDGQALLSFPPELPDEPYSDDYYAEIEQEHDDAEAQDYAAHGYDEDTPRGRWRSRLVYAASVLGLILLGVAGAFGYRAMVGASMLPGLPPIIKANNGPNKIVPSHGSAQASAAVPADASKAGSAEKLVSHQEKPVVVQQQVGTAPHVVSTIPIMPAPDATASAAPAGTPAIAAGSPPAAAAAPARPAAPALRVPDQHAATTPPLPPPAARKVHTVSIRPDQLRGAGTASIQPAAPRRPEIVRPAERRPRTEFKPGVEHRVEHRTERRVESRARSSAPLSIVPERDNARAPRQRTRTSRAAEPTPLAAPLALNGTTPSRSVRYAASGHYAVQLTSQRSDAGARAAYRSLQGRFPQLRGRAPMVRRANLGAKGVYYRALVGPFGSAEQADSLCNSLKAAGGNCIVEKD
jgi:SPOR domain